MSNKDLKPLSPEEAAKFERSRISDAVVQNKCTTCNAWYETPRLSHSYKESFFCDCGNHISFDVPAAPGQHLIIAPSNEAIIAALDPDAKLDTGMSVKEAIHRASQWWNTKGRHLAAKDERHDPADGTGIMRGLIWDALTQREKIQVVKVHHHFMTRKKDLMEDDGQDYTLTIDRDKVN